MNRCVYVTDLDGPTRVAVFEDGQLVRYISDDAEKSSLVGQIFFKGHDIIEDSLDPVVLSFEDHEISLAEAVDALCLEAGLRLLDKLELLLLNGI
jgi:hypothetical protein